jgi:hypothetical protein
MQNKFETLDEEDHSNATQDTPVTKGSSGTVYDWSNAPETIKAPPRIDLDGKTVTIVKADIILPPKDVPWQKTKDGLKDTKFCQFRLYYDVEGQQEFISGVRIFKANDGNYSQPSMPRDRKNQASQLLGLYADHKQKNINEVSLREFMGWLNSQPKVVIKATESRNPRNDEIVKKNIPSKIV